jgi:hypothetical protein
MPLSATSQFETHERDAAGACIFHPKKKRCAAKGQKSGGALLLLHKQTALHSKCDLSWLRQPPVA